MKKHLRDYSRIRYDDLPKVQEPGERKIIEGFVNIDRSAFRKTDEEKLRLKLAKAGIDTPAKKKQTRGGWQWRWRRRLAKEGLTYEEIKAIIIEAEKNYNLRTRGIA